MSDSVPPIRSKDVQLWKRKPPTSSRIPQGKQLSEDEQRYARYTAEFSQILRRFQKEIRSEEEEEKSA